MVVISSTEGPFLTKGKGGTHNYVAELVNVGNSYIEKVQERGVQSKQHGIQMDVNHGYS